MLMFPEFLLLWVVALLALLELLPTRNLLGKMINIMTRKQKVNVKWWMCMPLPSFKGINVESFDNLCGNKIIISGGFDEKWPICNYEENVAGRFSQK